jgi:hypothetical protein
VKAAELVACVDAAPDATPAERLLAGLDAYVAFIEVQPTTYRALVRSAGSDPQLLAVFEETRAAVVDLVASALGTDDLPAGLRLALRGWLALVEEATLHWLDEAPVARADLLAFLHRSALALLADPVAAAG